MRMKQIKDWEEYSVFTFLETMKEMKEQMRR